MGLISRVSSRTYRDMIEFDCLDVQAYCEKNFELEIKNGRVRVNTKRFIEKYQPLLEKVKSEANELIQDILEEYRFEEIFICFDGGKDGHVVLDLILKQLSFDHNPNDEINVVAS